MHLERWRVESHPILCGFTGVVVDRGEDSTRVIEGHFLHEGKMRLFQGRLCSGAERTICGERLHFIFPPLHSRSLRTLKHNELSF